MVILWIGKNIIVIEFCLFNMYVEHVYALLNMIFANSIEFFFFSFFLQQKLSVYCR